MRATDEYLEVIITEIEKVMVQLEEAYSEMGRLLPNHETRNPSNEERVAQNTIDSLRARLRCLETITTLITGKESAER